MTPQKIALGEKLYWDGRLSGNGSMACSACHLPDPGWGTGSPISFGYPGTQHWRNSRTVLNPAYCNKGFREGYRKGISEDTCRTTGTDLGLYFRTRRPEDRGKFRTPARSRTGWPSARGT